MYRVELKSAEFYRTISRIVSHFLLKLWLLGLHLFTKNGTSLKILKENQRPMYFNNLKKKKRIQREQISPKFVKLVLICRRIFSIVYSNKVWSVEFYNNVQHR